jgi:hypothetical protein
MGLAVGAVVMPGKLRFIFVAMLALLLSRAAAGQTTQPSSDASADNSTAGDWALVVRHFAEALSAEPASATTLLRPIVVRDCTVHRFDGGGSQLSDLLDHTAGATLVSARGYLAPVATMAADIADDASNCGELPDEVKKSLTPPDVEAKRRANATAARWVGSTLQASAGQPVGVVIQWLPEIQSNDPTGNSISQRLLMILVKGQLGSDGKYYIRQIVYGNTRQATQ